MVRLCPLLVLLTACGAQPHHETVPFRFRQSFLLGGGGPGGTSFTRESRRRRRVRRRRPPRREKTSGGAIARRCRGLRGKTFKGPRDQATLRLLRACVGQKLSTRALRGAALHRDPRIGDVVLFHKTGDATAGVVIARRGPRVRFLYLHPTSGRARVGTLNLDQPNRRRLRRSARIQNTFLRVKRRTDPPSTRYLAGQLLAGFATWRL
jgi:hypothetical protein